MPPPPKQLNIYSTILSSELSGSKQAPNNPDAMAAGLELQTDQSHDVYNHGSDSAKVSAVASTRTDPERYELRSSDPPVAIRLVNGDAC